MSLVIVFLSLECVCRIYEYDIKTLSRSLYYEASAFNELYRTSSPERIYELMPNQNASIYEPTGYDTVSVITNNAGFRNSFDIEKETDKYRIVMLGGSNAFGFCVNNDGTYAHLMQKEFDKKYPNKVEILNGGLCAYVMSQKIAYAKEVISKYNPDMLIIQDINTGRRPFSMKIKPSIDLFSKNKQLFIENIPLLLLNNILTKKIHSFLVSASALYRTIMNTTNTILIAESALFRQKFYQEAHACGETNNKKAFSDFIKEYSHEKTIIVFNPTATSTRKTDFMEKKGLYYNITFATKQMPEEYRQIHPKKHVYQWFSRRMVSLLDEFIVEHLKSKRHKESKNESI